MSTSPPAPDPDGTVPNRKLAAIQVVKDRAMRSQTTLAEWTTSMQSIPSAVDPKTINPTILTGGATAVDLSTDGLNDDIWDSPAAADYQASITKAIGDADTALSTIIDCLAAAENHQIYYVGERVTPDQPEAVWDLGEIMQC